MTYKELLKKVAKVEGVTCEKVDAEIKNAIDAIGIDIEPMELITLILAQIIIENENK